MAQQKCELSFLSRSDGSALYSIGGTVMAASVHGPADVKVSNRLFDSIHLDVCYHPRSGSLNVTEKTIESMITQTVKQSLLSRVHPRTAISLTIQEMQSAGLALSASMNAACFALMDAGVQMKFTFAAVTCCLLEDNVCIVEPSEIELKESRGVLTYVFDGQKLDVISSHQDGSYNTNDVKCCLLKCRESVKDIFAFYRRVIDEKYSSFFS